MPHLFVALGASAICARCNRLGFCLTITGKVWSAEVREGSDEGVERDLWRVTMWRLSRTMHSSRLLAAELGLCGDAESLPPATACAPFSSDILVRVPFQRGD